MKKFSIVAVLVMMFTLLIIPSVCNADVAGSYSVSSISVTMSEPKYGIAPPTTGTASGSNVQLKVTKVEWYDSNNKVLGSNDVLKAEKYTAVVTVEKTGGSDALRGTTRVYLNGSAEGVTNKTELCNSTKIVFSKEYTVSSRTVSNGRLSNVGGTGTITLNTIEFTFDTPAIGAHPATSSSVKVTSGLENIVIIKNLSWVDEEKFLGTNDTFSAGNYESRLFFNLAKNYLLAGDAIIKVNGEMVACREVSAGEYKCINTYTLTAAARPSTSTGTAPSRPTPLREVSIVVEEPQVGKALAKTCKVTTNLDGEKEIKILDAESAQALIDANPTSAESNVGYWKPSAEKATAGEKYIFSYRFNIRGVARLAELPVKINGKEATLKVSEGDIVASYTFEMPAEEKPEVTEEKPTATEEKPQTSGEQPTATEQAKSGENKPQQEEKKWVNQFDISITSPKIGEKPATTAKANKDGFSISKVTWTPNDSEFKAGVNYKVKINVKIDDGRDLRSDYFGVINGIQAKMPNDYDKNDFYVELSFGILDKKVEWSKASDWAKPELDKANELSLIPTIFDKGDLTTNITRREFAHVAVKLYESIAGQKAIASVSNPFTDTDDTEIMKAYNVGITNGTSATTFAPDALITREQMATMMTRALEKAGIDTSIDLDTVPKFSDDAEMHDWGRKAIYFMSNVNIIKGIGENKFGVLGNATKEQSLAISERSVEYFAK